MGCLLLLLLLQLLLLLFFFFFFLGENLQLNFVLLFREEDGR